MKPSRLKIEIVHFNDQIRVEDLLEIRTSYPMVNTKIETVLSRYTIELKQIDNRIFFLGFCKENSPFGYVQLIIQNADCDPELANGVELAHIHDLRIKKDLQGQGLGQGLVKYLEAYARLKGKKILTLGVDNWNSRAISFYKNLGYSEFKQQPGRTEEEFVIYMKKKI